MSDRPFSIHPAAEVSPEAHIGAGTRIWNQVQVREHAHIGEACNIGKGVYIGAQHRKCCGSASHLILSGQQNVA
jgi:UDP-2-acetamido-3-amino-2,3-dideoxy-glucuronate N-acetyltransferase